MSLHESTPRRGQSPRSEFAPRRREPACVASARLIAVLAACLLSLAALSVPAQGASMPAPGASIPDAGSFEPVAEVRAVWISNALLGRLGGPDGVLELLDKLAHARVNVILPEAVFRGYTLYPGPYQDPRFARWPVDPLDFIARAAARRGMEVHPWVWVFAAGLDPAPGPLLAAHPHWAECPPGTGLAAGGDARTLPAAGRTLWLTPADPDVRTFLLEEFLGLLRRYPVHGLHLDYIRYSEAPCGDGLPRASTARYQAETGIDAARLPAAGDLPATAAEREAAAAWHLWREAQVTTFVRDLSAAMRAENADWILSAAVTPEIREARYLRLQDWEHWLANGWVDYVFPMTYASTVGLVRTMAASWNELGPLRERLVPGLLAAANSLFGLLEQMEAVREEPVGGVALFAADHMVDAHWEGLRRGPFAAPAVLPFRDEAGGVRRPPAQSVPPKAPPVFAIAPQHDDDGGTNLAARARVTVDSSFRGYGPGPLNDGRRNDEVEIGRWAEVAWASAETAGEHWIVLEWDEVQHVGRVDIYWARDRDQFHSSRSYRVEAWLDGDWQVLFAHETAAGTTRVTRHSVSFVPVATTRLRIVQPEGGGPAERPHLMWVAEVEVYGG